MDIIHRRNLNRRTLISIAANALALGAVGEGLPVRCAYCAKRPVSSSSIRYSSLEAQEKRKK